MARQRGVVSRAQLRALGASDSWIRARIEAARWQRPYPGVYVGHSGPIDYRTRVWAAVLYCGAGALASHDTAAYLLGLRDTAPTDVQVSVPVERRVRRQPGLTVRRRSSAARETGTSNSPPRTSAEDTVIDLVARARTEVEAVGVVTSALVRRVTRPARLRAALDRRRRLRWSSLIGDIVSPSGSGIESPLEWRYRNRVEFPHGLPNGRRQVVLGDGFSTQRRDVYYDAYAVGIELDGRVGHQDDGVFRDAARDNVAASWGEVLLRYGWSDVVGRPCLVAVQVAAVLRSRGWLGVLRPCGPGCAVNAETSRC